MAKRKLSKQQARRIAKERVASSEQMMTDQSSGITTEQAPGLVITNFGKRVLVESVDGGTYTCSIRQHLGKLVAGDRVIWQTDREPGTGVIDQLVERKTLLCRPGFRGETRMVAANITLIGIVMPVLPGIHPDMIDRYLVAAGQLNIPSFIILNKVDLIDTEKQEQEIDQIMQMYRALAIPVVTASSVSEHGLDQLTNMLNDQVSVFVGPSGAGKSSLINSLLPDLDIRIGELSEATGLGSHTTSNSILYHLPGGGDLIDSPGVRLFSPRPCSLKELEVFYHDIAFFAGQCKFSNCTHIHEPQCAIRCAVEKGQIAQSRLKSFHRLLEESGQQDT